MFMEEHFNNEFEPVIMEQITDDSIKTIVERLFANPDKAQPMIVNDPETGIQIAEFFIKIVLDEAGVFLQLEDFDSKEYEKRIVQNLGDKWSALQPGIFRFRIG
jgi:hypothetical protein